MIRLRSGDIAPELTGVGHDGATVSMESLRGRPVLVAFFRYASCPFCNLRVHNLRQACEETPGLGSKIVAVFQSPPKSLRAYVGRETTPFPLIGDPGLKLYRRWGVETSWLGTARTGVAALGDLFAALGKGYLPGRLEGPVHRLPADFLITEDGRIDTAFYASHASEHIPLTIIRDFLTRQL